MALRTKEQLELLFQQRREINERKRERELKKQKERQERLKRFKDERLPTIFIKSQPEEQKQPQIKLQVYGSNFIERFTDEEDLYTLFELKNIEKLYPNEYGRINWSVWFALVEKTHEKLNINK